MTQKKPVNVLVAYITRINHPELGRGWDASHVDDLMRRAGASNKAAQLALEALKKLEAAAKAAGKVRQTAAQTIEELDVLLKKAVAARHGGAPSGGSADVAPAAFTIDQSIEGAIGSTRRDMQTRLKALDAAKADALRDAKKAPASASNLNSVEAVEKRYAALRAATERGLATLDRFLKVWERVMPRSAIDAFATEFAKTSKATRTKLSALYAQRDALTQQLRNATGAKAIDIGAKLERCTSDINTLRNPLTKTLRRQFGSVRLRTLRAIVTDPKVRPELEKLGIKLNPKQYSVDFYMELKSSAGGGTLKLKLAVDHAETGFSDAVDAWVRSGDPRDLRPALEADNMQLLTSMENSVVIERLRAEDVFWSAEEAVPKALAKQAAVDALPGLERLGRDKAMIQRWENALGRSLSLEERETVSELMRMP